MIDPDKPMRELTVREHAIIQCATAMAGTRLMHTSPGRTNEAVMRQTNVALWRAAEQFVDSMPRGGDQGS